MDIRGTKVMVIKVIKATKDIRVTKVKTVMDTKATKGTKATKVIRVTKVKTVMVTKVTKVAPLVGMLVLQPAQPARKWNLELMTGRILSVGVDVFVVPRLSRGQIVENGVIRQILIVITTEEVEDITGTLMR